MKRLRRRAGLVTAALACTLVAAGCTSSGPGAAASTTSVPSALVDQPSPCLAAAGQPPCELAHRIDGLEPSAAISLPEDADFGDATPYSLDLRRTDDGLVGVFSRPADAGAPGGTSDIGEVGPAHLKGVRGTVHDTEYLVASRDLSSRAMGDLIDQLGDGPSELPGTSIAHQEESWVPGIGSVPVPTNAPSSLLSYTSSATEPNADQRSIAIATLEGGPTDIDVLGWWFGNRDDRNDGTTRFTTPAYDVPDGGTAPEAQLIVGVGPTGTVAIVRTVGVSDRDSTKAFEELAPVQRDAWNELRRTYRTDDGGG